jgi:hypothetical protein
MKRSILFLTLIVQLIFSCNDTKRTKEYPISIKYGNGFDFVNNERTAIIDEFHKYFEPSGEDLSNPNIEILKSDSLEYKNLKIFIMNISAESSRDWSYCEKLIVFSNSGIRLFETPLTQYDKEYKIPECGVADYNIDEAFKIDIDKAEFLVLDINEHYWNCASQPSIQKKELRIYTIPDLYGARPLSYYEWTSFLEDRIDTQGIEHLEIDNEKIRIRETVYRDTILQEQNTKEFTLNEILLETTGYNNGS